jgi:hypothetical protein
MFPHLPAVRADLVTADATQALMFLHLPAVRADLVTCDGATGSEEEETTAVYTCRATWNMPLAVHLLY